MKSIITLLFCLSFLFPPVDISMFGVKIGSVKTSLDKIKLKVTAQEENMVKYKTNNGNDFSITLDNGKVAYMENDWLQDEKQRKPLFSNFEFGLTSLKDIRQKFGTNGFTYKSRPAFATETHLIEFNCFEFDSPNHGILVIVTKVLLKANPTEKNVAEKLKLDAIIIASEDYLDKTWGAQKLLDPNYKTIKP